ncbi:unnamed protein product [Arctogadus glacialis]
MKTKKLFDKRKTNSERPGDGMGSQAERDRSVFRRETTDLLRRSPLNRRGKLREEQLRSSSRSLRSASVTRLSGSSSNDSSRPWLHPTLLEEPSQPRILLVQWSPSKHHLSSGADTALRLLPCRSAPSDHPTDDTFNENTCGVLLSSWHGSKL